MGRHKMKLLNNLIGLAIPVNIFLVLSGQSHHSWVFTSTPGPLMKSRITKQHEYVKTETQISCAVTAQLISVFVFATNIVQFLFF